jgi:hypothetical protein
MASGFDGPLGDRTLVAGWFSWPDCGATAGDLLARDVACTWLARSGRAYDVANHPRFGYGVDWRRADPSAYSDLVFVCGPVDPSSRWHEMSQRFPRSRKIGLDVTMIRPVAQWNPFDVLLERDSDRCARPDLSFLAPDEPVPVVGLMLVGRYEPEYPGRDRQEEARRAATALVSRRSAACVPIDTVLPSNAGGLRTAREVTSLVARMDVVVTTRLHGLVLALKHGVPAVAIDPVAGGSKILRQAQAVGWPAVKAGDDLDVGALDELFAFCLTDEAKRTARACTAAAAESLAALEVEFRGVVGVPSSAS